MANILIVDDKPRVARLLKQELCDAGHRVFMVWEEEAIEKAIGRFMPCLVLLDLYLGRRDRWDLLWSMKRKHPRLPVIILTAHDGYQSDPRIALAEAFVLKSISSDELLKQVARFAGNRNVPRLSLPKIPRHSLPASHGIVA
jgi:two-component system response regulator GlrR